MEKADQILVDTLTELGEAAVRHGKDDLSLYLYAAAGRIRQLINMLKELESYPDNRCDES